MMGIISLRKVYNQFFFFFFALYRFSLLYSVSLTVFNIILSSLSFFVSLRLKSLESDFNLTELGTWNLLTRRESEQKQSMLGPF